MFNKRLPETPPWSTEITSARLLAVDVETTGLNPKEDHLVSIGWVPVNGDEIDLAGSGYVVVKGAPSWSVGASATIHHLTDDDLSHGVTPEEACESLLEALHGRMMLAHYETVETSFLGALIKDMRGKKYDLRGVDTFAIERRRMERKGTYPRGEDLRLRRVRARYGLPGYRSHNALTDALACAELYLAQTANLRARTLKDLRYW